MTIMEYLEEAAAEIRSLLEDRVRRLGECQISSDTIKKTLAERFSNTKPSALWLSRYVACYLLGAGLLKVWDTKKRKTGYGQTLIIYQVVVDKVQNSYLPSLGFSE